MAIQMQIQCAVCNAAPPGATPQSVVATNEGVAFGLSELLNQLVPARWHVSPSGDVLCEKCFPAQTGAKLIAIEGMDGCGKSTVAHAVADKLREAGEEAVIARDLETTKLGGRIRGVLLDHDDEIPHVKAETLLFFAARAQLEANVIQPALARGDWVICDRFTTSTYIYQGVIRGLGAKAIEVIEQWTLGELRPAMTYVLDVDHAVAQARRASIAPDRIERTNEAIEAQMRDAYLEQVRNNPATHCLIDASGLPEEIAQTIVTEIGGLVEGRSIAAKVVQEREELKDLYREMRSRTQL